LVSGRLLRYDLCDLPPLLAASFGRNHRCCHSADVRSVYCLGKRRYRTEVANGIVRTGVSRADCYRAPPPRRRGVDALLPVLATGFAFPGDRVSFIFEISYQLARPARPKSVDWGGIAACDYGSLLLPRWGLA